MTNHVPALETSQRLKAAGFPQETYFTWVEFSENNPILMTTEDAQRLALDKFSHCAAPLLTEILEQLPKATALARGEYRGKDSYVVCLQQHSGRWVPYESMAGKNFYNANPAEAAALLWLELKEACAKD